MKLNAIKSEFLFDLFWQFALLGLHAIKMCFICGARNGSYLRLQ